MADESQNRPALEALAPDRDEGLPETITPGAASDAAPGAAGADPVADDAADAAVLPADAQREEAAADAPIPLFIVPVTLPARLVDTEEN